MQRARWQKIYEISNANLGFHSGNIVYAYKQNPFSPRASTRCTKHNEFSISIILGITGYFIIIDADKRGFGQDKPRNEL